MHTRGLLERLKELFSSKEHTHFGRSWVVTRNGEPLARRPAFAAPTAAQQAADVQTLVARLERANIPDVVAGCVQILGFDETKKRFGDKWIEFQKRAFEIAQEVLDDHLSAGDIYRLVNDSSFQICFESSDEAQAAFQVRRISAAVEARIWAELGKDDLSIESFVASVPCARIRDSSDPLSTLYAGLIQIREAVNSRVVRRHSIPALRYAGALFQPMWSRQDFGITKNRCLLDALAGAAATKYLEEIEHLEDLVGALSNLDCVVFAKSIEGLHQALGEIKQATIVIPVHFQTLATQQQEFLDIANTLPLPYRRFVMLDLIGVPTAATRPELLKVLNLSRSIADRIVLQMSSRDGRIDQNVRNLIWGMSMTVDDLDSDDATVARELTQFALVAAEHGLYSFAYGANTIGKAIVVVRSGFDYVCGTAVAPTASVPKPHARFKPLFGDVTPRNDVPGQATVRRGHPRFAPVDPNSTLTLLDGTQHHCRVPNVSSSGAEVLCQIAVQEIDYLVLGSIPAQVVRLTKNGFAVRFLEIQQHSAIEVALQTPSSDMKLLGNLKKLTQQQHHGPA